MALTTTISKLPDSSRSFAGSLRRQKWKKQDYGQGLPADCRIRDCGNAGDPGVLRTTGDSHLGNAGVSVVHPEFDVRHPSVFHAVRACRDSDSKYVQEVSLSFESLVLSGCIL